ncbi:MAG TPA: ATP-binding protein [Actinomycetota bacterium]|nr:ATP-binding protein [Actinomycetota bacterium]
MNRRWEIALDERAANVAREALRSTLTPVLPREQLDDVLVSASELVSNAVRHSGARGRGSLALQVRLEARSLQVEVTDPGPGFDAEGTPEPPPLPVSGYGLRIVERLSDRWEVNSSGPTRVRFEIDLGRTRGAHRGA